MTINLRGLVSINEAGWDRAGRVLLGVVILGLGWSGIVGGTLGLIFKGLGFVPLLTGLVGWCPLYAAFGMSSCKIPPQA